MLVRRAYALTSSEFLRPDVSEVLKFDSSSMSILHPSIKGGVPGGCTSAGGVRSRASVGFGCLGGRIERSGRTQGGSGGTPRGRDGGKAWASASAIGVAASCDDKFPLLLHGHRSARCFLFSKKMLSAIPARVFLSGSLVRVGLGQGLGNP